MQAVAENTCTLSTPDKRRLVFLEKSSGLIRGLLVDEVGNPVQASQLSSMKLWLHLKDDTTQPVGGINSVSDVNILNDGTRGSIGNAKSVTGATVNTVDDDFRGLVRLTIDGHGYGDGDLIAVRGMKTFRNTILAQTWKEKIEKLDRDSLYQRREMYDAACPRGVVVLIASVDVQDNRLEATIKGWGAAEQSWSIEYRIFQGSPSLPAVWMELTDWLQQPRDHMDGVALHVEAVGVDTGGHHTKEAYRFIEKYRGEAFALKGSSEPGAPEIPKREPKKHRSFRLRLYLLGTNALKDTIFARMKLTEPGPGFMHFPRRGEYDEEYFQGLASEVKKPRYKPRSHIQTGYYYEKEFTRNEPLDLEVYNLATLLLWLQQRKTTLEKLTAAWAQIIERAKVKPLPLPGITESGNDVPGITTQPLPAVTLIQPRPGRRVLSSGVQ